MRRLLPLTLLSLPALACHTVNSASLVPPPVEVGQHHAGSVHVAAAGSGRAMGIGRALISGGELAAAVETAIAHSRLFQGTAEAEEASWILAVAMVDIEKSEPSLDMKGTTTISWTLTKKNAKETTWSEEITTSHEATPDDASDVTDRGHMAIEGAVQKNIEQAIRAMGKLAS